MTRQKTRKALIIVSFLLFPLTINYFSPVLVIMASTQGVIAGSFITFAVLFVSSLLLGRAWCGWLCPAAGLQEVCFAVRERRVERGNWIKYAIWVPWLAVIVSTAARAGGLGRIEPFYMMPHVISIDEPAGFVIFYTVSGLILLLSLAGGKRAFCHWVCWMAPLMVIGRAARNAVKWPSLRLASDRTKCIECGRCSKACPMSLGVEDMVKRTSMENTECILCGACVDVCPKNVIEYSFK